MSNTKAFIAKNGIGVGDGYTLPNIRPSLNLDFVNSKRVDPRIDFTRSTTATYYDGKTTAKAEENLITNSNSSNGGAQNCTVTLNSGTAPDGTATATLITEDATTNFHRVFRVGGVSGTSFSGTVSASLFMKSNGRDFAFFEVYDNTGYAHSFGVAVDLTDGSTTTLTALTTPTSFSVTDAGNGWYRISITCTIDTLHSFNVYTYDNNGSSKSYTGDGTSGVYIWGAQLEQRDSVTAYTPTTDSTITNYVPVLQTAGINEPRLDHDPVTGECKGLLMEGSRTNLLTYSKEFSVSIWQKSHVTVQQDVGIAPDGTLTASVLSPAGTNQQNIIRFNTNMSAGSYTWSVYAKARGYERCWLTSYNSTDDYHKVEFDLANGTIASGVYDNASITPVGNGWYRCTMSAVTSAESNYGIFQIRPTYSDGEVNQDIFIWGAQLEQAGFPSSYIPTDGATVTRGDDNASVNTSDIVKQSDGTFFAEWVNNNTSLGYLYGRVGTAMSMHIGYDTTNYWQPAISRRPNNRLALQGQLIGGQYASFGAQLDNYTYAEGQVMKAGFSYQQGQPPVLAGNGSIDTDNTDQTHPLQNSRLHLARNYDTRHFNHIHKVSYYPQKIADSELQALTQE